MRTGCFEVEGRGKVFTSEFDLSEYSEEVSKLLRPDGTWRGFHTTDAWADSSGQTPTEFVRDVESGGTARHASLIARAREQIKVPAFRLYGQTVGMGVGAGVPIIPAVLSGHPQHVLTLTDAPDYSTPVRVIYDRVSSSNLNAGDVERTAATVAAVIEILQASRPVEVFVVANLDAAHGLGESARGGSKRLQAASMRIKLSAHASNAELGLFLVSLGPIRRGLHSLAKVQYGYSGQWPFGTYGESAGLACMADLAGPHDIVITSLYSGHPLVKNPAAWAESALEAAFSSMDAA